MEICINTNEVSNCQQQFSIQFSSNVFQSPSTLSIIYNEVGSDLMQQINASDFKYLKVMVIFISFFVVAFTFFIKYSNNFLFLS